MTDKEYTFAGPWVFEASATRLAIRNKETDKVYKVDFSLDPGLGVDGVQCVFDTLRQQFEMGEAPDELTESNARNRDARMAFIAGVTLGKIEDLIKGANLDLEHLARATNTSGMGPAPRGVDAKAG